MDTTIFNNVDCVSSIVVIKMPIGKIITIDDKTKSVIGEASGCFMMNGSKATLTETLNPTPANMSEVHGIAFRNYIPHVIKGPLGGNLINMYGLQVQATQRQEDGSLYGRVELGYFTMAILFLRKPGEMIQTESGGTEWPLWQVNELMGYRVPLVDSSGNIVLEDICFGTAQWDTKKEYGRYEYVWKEKLLVDNAAEKVIGINREDFRTLALPIAAKLKEIFESYHKP